MKEAKQPTDTNALLEFQLKLRNLLFVRPFDISAIESAAVNLCDAVIDPQQPETVLSDGQVGESKGMGTPESQYRAKLLSASFEHAH